jgi:hypothetical protein
MKFAPTDSADQSVAALRINSMELSDMERANPAATNYAIMLLTQDLASLALSASA